MRAELGLPSVRGDDDKGGGMMGGFGGSMGGVGGGKSKRPIQVKFEIPYFTTSGIQVRYLKIIEPKVCHRYAAFVSHEFSIHFMLLSVCATDQAASCLQGIAQSSKPDTGLCSRCFLLLQFAKQRPHGHCGPARTQGKHL